MAAIGRLSYDCYREEAELKLMHEQRRGLLRQDRCPGSKPRS